MKYNPKNQVKADGKMSTQGADTVGKILAIAALILATGVALSIVLLALVRFF